MVRPSLLAASLLWCAATTTTGAPVLVLPVPSPAGAVDAEWVGVAIEALLPAALERAGIQAFTYRDRVQLFEDLGLPNRPVTRATAIRVAEAAGVTRVVVATCEASERHLQLRGRILDVEQGAMAEAVERSGEVEGIQKLVSELAQALATQPGSASAPSQRGPRAVSLDEVAYPALRAYARSLVARNAGERVRFLVAALREDSRCEDARLELAQAQLDAKRPGEALKVLVGPGPVVALSPRGRFLEGIVLLDLERYVEAAALYAELVQERPSAAALSNQAVALLRVPRSGTVPSRLLRRACEMGDMHPDLVFNLAWSLLLERDPSAAAFWLRGLMMEDPGDVQARVVLSWALREAGRGHEADEEWRAVMARAPGYADLAQPRHSRRFERVVRSERRVFVDQRQRSQAHLASTHLERGDQLLAGGDGPGALRELTQAAYLNPYDDRTHVRLAEAHLALGSLERAVNELRMALWCRERTDVRARLAELLLESGKAEEARRQAQAVLAVDPADTTARTVLERSMGDGRASPSR